MSQNKSAEQFKITHKGVTLALYIAPNTPHPMIILHMSNKKGVSLSLGLDERLTIGVSSVIANLADCQTMLLKKKENTK